MKLVVGFLVVVLLVVAFFRGAESTICAPLSFFKVGETLFCRCSATGKEYTCKEISIQRPSVRNANFKDDDDTYVLYTHPQRRSYGLSQITNDHFPTAHKADDFDEEDAWGSDESDSQEINSFEDFNKVHRHHKKYL